MILKISLLPFSLILFQKFLFFDKNQISNLINFIGLTGANKKVKYVRDDHGFRSIGFYDIYTIFFLSLLVFVYVDNNYSPVFIYSSLFILVLNKFFRFADIQTIIFYVFVCSILDLIFYPMFRLDILFLQYLLTNPMPAILSFRGYDHEFDKIPLAKPYNLNPILSKAIDFVKVKYSTKKYLLHMMIQKVNIVNYLTVLVTTFTV